MTVSESSFPSPAQASSPPLDPPQSCSPSPVSHSSETLINSSPISSPSVMQAEPPGLKESLMYFPAKSLVPTSTAHQRSTGNRNSRKYLPYPPDPLPLELRYAGQFMSRGYQLDFSPEAMEKLEEQLENGLSQMKTATLYKGYKAKLLTREVARQRLFLSTLEAEEADLTACYADAIRAENKECFGSAEEELQRYRSHFSQCGHLEADDDRNYLQAVYEDECRILRTVNIQTDQVAKILDKCIAQSLTDCTGYFPMRHRFCNEVQTTEPFHKDSDVTPEGSDDVENEHLSLSDLGSDE
ncbi:uncharacterized protein F5891DRAFT_1197652 [Suillus fuscotomentosus]|uniref:Uncharacterized protein n=1 Tax=Suillus fuscotomentosus TaxID=1912939 RepID=A0AAD4HEG5_9AGAM|nr:uncharacterized protein F5891DRAFT_1197652 [Suillus fuscotomentosus]KAG1891599.1 hypothetical protein F5891DRAFT_1197652 [Suillus fuscotomentosus]